MIQHDLKQGSQAWLAYRANHWNASDAAAMMGASSYKTRSQLLAELATGITEEVDETTQRRFDDGHLFEALGRPVAVEIVGDDLYPVVGSSDEIIGGRALSASFDGLTMMEDANFEHKRLNARLREAMFDGCTGLDLPIEYQIQMEQQHMVSGAARTLFMASEWERCGDDWQLVEERHCWYVPNPELATKIRAGWAQFAEDLANYKPEAVKAEPVAEVIETLPALSVRVEGRVLDSNLDVYRTKALEFINGIKTDLQTDSDFATAEKTVKFCKESEDRLDAVKDQIIDQATSIDEVIRTLDAVKEAMRQKRLSLDKLVTKRKEEIRAEIVTDAQAELTAHITSLNTRLGARWLPFTHAPFGDAIKGKKTLTSIKDAVSLVLANAKIEASGQAERYEANRASLTIEGRDWFSLFPDFATVGNKAPEDFEALAQLRISKHVESERQAAEAQKRAEEAAQAAIQHAAQTKVLTPQEAWPMAGDAPAAPVVKSEPAPWIEPAPAAANEPATVRLGEICTRVGQGFTMTAAFVEQVLGIKPAAVDKAAKLYTASDERRIYAALVNHLNGLQMAKAA